MELMDPPLPPVIPSSTWQELLCFRSNLSKSYKINSSIELQYLYSKIKCLCAKISSIVSIEILISMIDDDITESKLKNLIKDTFEGVKKKFIVHIKTAEEDSQIFWRFEDARIYKLNLLNHQTEVLDFVLDFLYCSLQIENHCGVDKTFLRDLHPENIICQVNLLSLADAGGCDLLMLAAEKGDENAVNCLLCEGFNVNDTADDKRAVDYAWENGHQHIVLRLLIENSVYPKNFSLMSAITDIINFWKESDRLHNFIKNSQKEEVLEILSNNLNQRYFYTTDNTSAAVLAIFYKELDIYDLLVSHNVFIGPNEDINSFVEKLNSKTRESLRGMNLKSLQKYTEDHILILLANSFIGCNTPKRDQKFEYIKSAFKYLNEINDSISLILKVVAASRDFNIIFDFNRESVQHLDPTSSQHTKGVFHTSRHIYVAVKELLDPARKLEAYGTLIHELTHYAMHLVYKNNCKPYFNDNNEGLEKFKEVSSFCQKFKNSEDLVKLAFRNYQKEQQHAELIVRAPHMMVQYSNDEARLDVIRGLFSILYLFFEVDVRRDLQQFLSNVRHRNDDVVFKYEHKMKRNKHQNKILKFLLLLMTLIFPIAIYTSSSIFGTKTYSCATLTKEARRKMENASILFQDFPVLYRNLFGTDENSCEYLSAVEVTRIVYSHGFVHHSTEFYGKAFNDPKLEPYINVTRNGRADDLILEDYKSLTFGVKSFKVGSGIRQKLDPDLVVKRTPKITLNEKKLFLLSDSTKSGKTTTFRFIGLKLKYHFPLRWVSFIDLKGSPEIFENFTSSWDDNQKFQFLCTNVLNLSTKVEVTIFEKKFKANEVILLWDDIEEMKLSNQSSSSLRTNVLNLVDWISKISENHQWISTPSVNQTEIISFLGTMTKFELGGFDLEEFVETYLTSMKYPGLDVQNAKETIKEIMKDLQILNDKNQLIVGSAESLEKIVKYYIASTKCPVL